jgi:hypothetical protein
MRKLLTGLLYEADFLASFRAFPPEAGGLRAESYRFGRSPRQGHDNILQRYIGASIAASLLQVSILKEMHLSMVYVDRWQMYSYGRCLRSLIVPGSFYVFCVLFQVQMT